MSDDLETTNADDDADLDDDNEDPGGVAYDDGLPEEDTDTKRVGMTRGIGPKYDSPKKLQQRNIAYPEKAPPGMLRLRSHILDNHGGANLGILAKPPRSFRGPSDTPSLHNWGMAWDWQWKKPGPGRAGADEVIAWCIEHANDLGIQAVHDYEACRYWKSYAPKDGWRDAHESADTGFGQPWAQWLHIERTHAAANDERKIDLALAEGGSSPTPVDRSVPLPETDLRQGMAGAAVARLQDFLRMFGYATFSRSNGRYGPRTKAAVIAAQTEFADKGLYNSKIDGRWGPKSNEAAQKFIESQS